MAQESNQAAMNCDECIAKKTPSCRIRHTVPAEALHVTETLRQPEQIKIKTSAPDIPKTPSCCCRTPRCHTFILCCGRMTADYKLVQDISETASSAARFLLACSRPLRCFDHLPAQNKINNTGTSMPSTHRRPTSTPARVCLSRRRTRSLVLV